MENNFKEISDKDFILNPNMNVFNKDGNEIKIKLSYNDIERKHSIYMFDNDRGYYKTIEYVDIDNLWYNSGFLCLDKFKLYTNKSINNKVDLVHDYYTIVDEIVHTFARKHQIDLGSVNHSWVNDEIGGKYDFVEYTVPFLDITFDLFMGLDVGVYSAYMSDTMMGKTTMEYRDWYYQNNKEK